MSGKQTNNGAVSPLRGGGRGDRTEGGRVVIDNGAGAGAASAAGAGDVSGASAAPLAAAKGKIGGLSIYRMQLLGTEGLRRYRETGHIPDDLLD